MHICGDGPRGSPSFLHHLAQSAGGGRLPYVDVLQLRLPSHLDLSSLALLATPRPPPGTQHEGNAGSTGGAGSGRGGGSADVAAAAGRCQWEPLPSLRILTHAITTFSSLPCSAPLCVGSVGGQQAVC